MSEFPNGYLLIAEFENVSSGHILASKSAGISSHLRLIEVSPTARGSWVCAWLPDSASDELKKLEDLFAMKAIQVTNSIMDAFLSLAPNPEPATSDVWIIESAHIETVFLMALRIEKLGGKIFEIKIKRAGPSGAVALIGASSGVSQEIEVRFGDKAAGLLTGSVTIARASLVGDYKRYFI